MSSMILNYPSFLLSFCTFFVCSFNNDSRETIVVLLCCCCCCCCCDDQMEQRIPLVDPLRIYVTIVPVYVDQSWQFEYRMLVIYPIESCHRARNQPWSGWYTSTVLDSSIPLRRSLGSRVYCPKQKQIKRHKVSFRHPSEPFVVDG